MKLVIVNTSQLSKYFPENYQKNQKFIVADTNINYTYNNLLLETQNDIIKYKNE